MLRRTSSTRISVNSLPVFSLMTRSSTSRPPCPWRRCGARPDDRARPRARPRSAPPALAGRDAPARSAPADMPGSPCRCRAGRRSARHGECARFDRPRATCARPRRARTARRFRAGARLPCRHRRRSRRRRLGRQALQPRMQALFDGRPNAICHDLARRAPVDDDAALGFGFDDGDVGLAQFLMKLDRLRLETVGCGLGRAGAWRAPGRPSPERRGRR